MYGIYKTNIQGNGRIAQKMPRLAINITALEDDLLYVMDRFGIAKFKLIQRDNKDKFNNEYLLNKGNTSKANQVHCRISQREPKTVIDITLTDNFIKSKRLQGIKNNSGFLKFYILELDEPDNNGSQFEIRVGHFEYDKEMVK